MTGLETERQNLRLAYQETQSRIQKLREELKILEAKQDRREVRFRQLHEKLK